MTDKSKPDLFKKYLGISIFLHIAIILFSTVSTKCSNNEIILPPSVQVDLVAPPQQQAPVDKAKTPTAEPPAAEKKELPKKEELPEKIEPKVEPEGPKVNLKEEKKKKELKLKKEKEKKKELEKKKKKKKEEDKKRKKKQELEKQKKIRDKQKAAINKLEQKKALENLTKKAAAANTGKRINNSSFDGLDSIQFQKYFGDIKAHLFNNWSLPQWLSELDLKAKALVVIDSSGYVVKSQIIESSGNSNFDDSVLAAIKKASPFPVAPDRLRNKINNKEIVFGFPRN